ncbi:MAG: homocysteine S-methyltransferase family protein [Candidatus Muirbacterium halophilum]|nr:homocysteine S-methyltransferase family protein [Candidatus Muirbacterium halophilum]MCK9474952.1 homocysteine S-methyltransferase family protein [Candidatus Muirbacterium halophilum]
MRNIIEEIKNKVLLIDGGLGSLLQKKGLLLKGKCPELLNIDNASDIKAIHSEYINAGADILTTNSFGANYFKLKEYGLEDKIVEINKKSAELAKKAAGDNNFVAGSIGPTGRFIRTEGDLSLEDAIKYFSIQAKALADGGADLFIVETMFDLWELKAAVMGIKKVSNLPIIAHLTYQENGRTLTGTDPCSHVITMESLGVFCVGSNCSLGAREMIPIAEKIRENATGYVSCVPNAGLPVLVDGKTVFPMKPDEFGECSAELIKKGVNIIGGCCGTEFEHIKAARKAIENTERKIYFRKPSFSLCSRTKGMFLDEKGFFLIGERLNPTARKKLSKALMNNDFEPYIEEAKEQELALADIIDVNVGIPHADENILLPKAISFVQGSIELPISIDSSTPAAIVEALKITDGKPLVNSINGKESSLNALMPVISEFGAAAIVLLVDEKGIPETLERRIEILEKVLSYAKKYNVKKENLIIDCLALAVAAEPYGPKLAIDTIRKITQEYGLATIMGISNVSYGLPLRKYLNSAFLSMCIGAGLKACIGNPISPTFMAGLKSSCFLANYDKEGKDFLKFSENFIDEKKSTKSKVEKKEILVLSKDALSVAIIKGLKDNLQKLIDERLKENTPLEIISKYLVPAIEEVGIKYDKQEFYLPQLISGAEAMQKGFEILKPLMKGNAREKLGKILLATVEGDVHDIGKNIVRVLLENFGFDVIDLGKDVKTNDLIEKIKIEKPDIVGLSALMTTTMSEMEVIIKKLKNENIRVKVMIGGAVVTEAYANEIGADCYGKDAMDAVKKAKEMMGKTELKGYKKVKELRVKGL